VRIRTGTAATTTRFCHCLDPTHRDIILVTMVGTADLVTQADLADPAEAHPAHPADPAEAALAAQAAEAEAAAGNATGLGVDGRAQRQQPRRGPQVLLAETPGQHLLAEDTVELAPGGQNRDARVVKPVGESHQS
jgi:hypothetical protein